MKLQKFLKISLKCLGIALICSLYFYSKDIGHVLIFIELANDTLWHPFTICALHSAAKTNPRTPVLFFSKKLQRHPNWKNLKNLKLIFLNETCIFEYTPAISNWYKNSTNHASKFFLFELSDALRLALLKQYEGTYLDSDFISLRPLTDVPSAALVPQQPGLLANGFLRLPKLNPCLNFAIANFEAYHRARIWGSTGPGLISAAAHHCLHVGLETLQEGMQNENLEILPKSSIFPVDLDNFNLLLKAQNTSKLQRILNNSHLIHLWRQADTMREPFIEPGSLIDIIFQQQCGMDIKKEFRNWKIINADKDWREKRPA